MSIIDQLEALYAELPEIACQGKCQTCCGPIDMSPAERQRIRERGIEIQPMTQDRVRAWEDQRRYDDHGQSLLCNALNRRTGQCDVYDVRPMVCRLWGLGEGPMKCSHGCKPTKLLSDDEIMDYLMRSMMVGGRFSAAELERVRAVFADPEMAKLTAAYMHGDKEARARIRADLKNLGD